MSNSLCKTSVSKTYQDVINDVISNAREHFMEDGMDETVLQELKQLWETKLSATKAVDDSKSVEKRTAVNHKEQNSSYNIHPNVNLKNPDPSQLIPPLQMQYPQQMVGQVPPNNHEPPNRMEQPFPDWRRVPIQLTIPAALGHGEGHRILSIDVPEVFLQGHHLKSILTGQVISTTMGLPFTTASAFLQEHVNAAFIKYQQSFYSVNPLMPLPDCNRLQNGFQELPQRDGTEDSSSEEDQDLPYEYAISCSNEPLMDSCDDKKNNGIGKQKSKQLEISSKRWRYEI